MSKQVIIIGAGGHGKVVADIVAAAGDTVLGFLDDSAEKTACADRPVLGTTARAEEYPDCWFALAVGSGIARKQLSERLPVRWYTAIHPAATVSPSAQIGEGTVVMAGVVVNADAKIGRHCIINTAAVVEHDNRLGDYVHISPGAVLGGTVRVDAGTHVGIGACVRNNVTICENCTIGAGAAVVKNIEKPGVYVGVPARRMKDE